MSEKETKTEAGDTKSTAPPPPQDDVNEKPSAPHAENKWGYDMYPERKGLFNLSLLRAIKTEEGREYYRKQECEENVYKCIKNDSMVKLMMTALKTSGCPVDLRRHLSCEICNANVTGGYDPQMNQIVICHNTATTANKVKGVLVHEFIHMFDFCRNNLDFKNHEHLACTEIRAANLAHCSFMGAYAQGDADTFNFKQKHRECVKTKALYSLLATRLIPHDEAIAVIEKVFPKCYADLEPIGRRIRRSSGDQEQAFAEAKYYGYY